MKKFQFHFAKNNSRQRADVVLIEKKQRTNQFLARVTFIIILMMITAGCQHRSEADRSIKESSKTTPQANAIANLIPVIYTSPTAITTQASKPGLGNNSDNDNNSHEESSRPLNARNFGAIGDGKKDDRLALQSAVDAAHITGKSLYIPAGTYLLSTSSHPNIIANLFIKPGLVMYGDGEKTILKRMKTDVTGYIITYDKAVHNSAKLSDRNYTLKDFKIQGVSGRGHEKLDGNPSEDDGGIFLATAANPSNKMIIENIVGIDFNKEVIAVWDAREVIIKNCAVYNCNHDAYNPQKIDNLILNGNISDGANFACEYDGRLSSGTTAKISKALIAGNSFINTHEYGLCIEAGGLVKVSNNLISGLLNGSTGQGIGIFIKPYQGDIKHLDILNNRINGFKNAGISTAHGEENFHFVSNLIIKGNSVSNSGENAIWLNPYDNSKIIKAEISNNTLYDWNQINHGNSFQFGAIGLQNLSSASIHSNRIYHTSTAGLRTDPLWLNNCSDIKFFNNDCNSNPSKHYSTLEIRRRSSDSGLVYFNNPGLGGGSTGELVNIILTAGDENTRITTGTAKVTYRVPFNMRMTNIRASLSTASSSGIPKFDIKANGKSILSKPLTIDEGEKTSTTASQPVAIEGVDHSIIFSRALTDDTEITVDITASGTEAKGVKIYLIGYK